MDHQRRQRAQQQGVTQQLNITGKGAEIFAKRQERMNNYVADGDNKIRSVAQIKTLIILLKDLALKTRL